jgi:hypothetical protein
MLSEYTISTADGNHGMPSMNDVVKIGAMFVLLKKAHRFSPESSVNEYPARQEPALGTVSGFFIN